MVGLAVAPTAPYETAYSSSSTAHESFQISVAVVAIVRPSGVSARGGVEPISVCVAPATGVLLDPALTPNDAVGYVPALRVIDYAAGAAWGRRATIRHLAPAQRAASDRLGGVARD